MGLDIIYILTKNKVKTRGCIRSFSKKVCLLCKLERGIKYHLNVYNYTVDLQLKFLFYSITTVVWI